MRIALCFFGYARTYPHVQDTYRKLFAGGHDVDAFITIPDTLFAKCEDDEINYSKDVGDVDRNTFEPVFGDALKVCEFYKQDIARFHEHAVATGKPLMNPVNQHTWRVYACYDSMRKSLEAQQAYAATHGIVYDYVMMMRLDLHIQRIDWGKLVPSIVAYPATATLERHPGAARVFGTDKCFNDQFFGGTPQHMNVVLGAYGNIRSMADRGIMINSETMLGYCFIDSRIPIGPIDFVTYVIRRP